HQPVRRRGGMEQLAGLPAAADRRQGRRLGVRQSGRVRRTGAVVRGHLVRTGGQDPPPGSRRVSEPAAAERWLVVIDPQNIFASPDSEWGSPFFAEAMVNIRRLAEAFGERVLVTRWMPTADRATSWGEYFAAWPFADKPASDPRYGLVPVGGRPSPDPTRDLPSFGRRGSGLAADGRCGADAVR